VANYPIIEERFLPKVLRGGPWGLSSPHRSASDVPRLRAHEILVYRWGGSYVVDDGRSRLSEDHVVNATSVSVVDMREDAPVTVQVSIPSADVGEFTIQVTFLCTVKKPEEVVEAGLTNMADSLMQYVVRHQPLFGLGEEYQFGQINTVRRYVWAEVRAYVTIRPPRFRGMDFKLGNVQVLTPEALTEFFFKAHQRELEGRRTADESPAPVFVEMPDGQGRRMDMKAAPRDVMLQGTDSRLGSPSRPELRGHVFISYVREDSLKVDRLQQVLETAGVRVWRDTADLWPGEDWREKIRHAITEDALVFLACFSSRSLARRKTYQNEELTLAIDQMRLRRPDEPWLIPVRFDDCDIPDSDIGRGRSLLSIHCADLSDDRFDDGATRLTAAVLRILG